MKKKIYNVEEKEDCKYVGWIFGVLILLFISLLGKATYDASKINYSTIAEVTKCNVYDSEWEHNPRRTIVYSVCEGKLKTFQIPGWVSDYEFNKKETEATISIEVCNLEKIDHWFEGFERGKNHKAVGEYNQGFINGAKAFIVCLDTKKGMDVCKKGLKKLEEEHKGDIK